MKNTHLRAHRYIYTLTHVHALQQDLSSRIRQVYPPPHLQVTCMYWHIHVCVCRISNIFIFAHLCKHSCICVCVCVCVASASVGHVRLPTFTTVCVCVCVYANIHVCVYICIFSGMSACWPERGAVCLPERTCAHTYMKLQERDILLLADTGMDTFSCTCSIATFA